MAALLTSEKDNTDKVVAHIAEARAAGHRGAAAGREPVGPGSSARWRGRSASAWAPSRAWARAPSRRSSRRARRGRSRDLFDFCERVDCRRVNRKVLEALVKAGAFDFEKRPRRQLFETIEKAMERGAVHASGTRRRGSARCSACWRGAAARAGGSALQDEYAPVEEWPEKERLPSRRRRSASTSPATRCTSTTRSCSATRGPSTAVQRARARREGHGGRHRRRAARAAHQDRASAWRG